jgi:hypothetical protein
MFSSASLKPNPTSLGSSVVGHYVGKMNEEMRPRGGLEEAIRVGSAVTPVTTGLNVASELAELQYHYDAEIKTRRNNMIKNAFDNEMDKMDKMDETTNPKEVDMLKDLMYDAIFEVSTDTP